MASWLEDIIQALENLGGEAHRRQIIDEVSRIRVGPLPIRLDETVQRTIQIHSSDSEAFIGKDIFRKLGNGFWALRDFPNNAEKLEDRKPRNNHDQQITQSSLSFSFNDEPKTWVEDIIQALKNLGGQAHLKDIVAEVRMIRNAPIPPTAINTASTSIISYSSDSKHYKGRADIFAKVGDGVWALRDINVDFHEAVGKRKRKTRGVQNIGSRHRNNYEEIENNHHTIRQYREFVNPESNEWEGYIVDLFSVLGFSVTEHLRIPNGAGKEFPVWFISPLEIPEKYVAVLGVIKKEYKFDEFLPNIPLSIILDAHRGINANRRNGVYWVIITDGNRIRILDYNKSREGQIRYENLNLDRVITQGFGTSFLKFYENLELIRSFSS